MSLPTLTLLAADSPLGHVVDHAIVKTDGGVYLLSNHMVMVVAAAVIMLLLFPALTRKYREGKLVPTGRRNFFEAILLFVRNDIAKPVLAQHTDRFIGYLWTLFFFILTLNLIGLLPLDVLTNPLTAAVGLEHPIYGTATANLYITGVLAIFSFVLWNAAGIREHGFGSWAHHFLGGAPWYMAPIMVPVELLGMIVKPAALAIRLMANMTAGHVLLAVLLGFVTAAWKANAALGAGVGLAVIIGATAIMVLELFVACLQAYIFTFLTALFIGQLVVHEEEHDEHEHDKVDAALSDVGDMTDSADLSQYGAKTEPAIQ